MWIGWALHNLWITFLNLGIEISETVFKFVSTFIFHLLFHQSMNFLTNCTLTVAGTKAQMAKFYAAAIQSIANPFNGVPMDTFALCNLIPAFNGDNASTFIFNTKSDRTFKCHFVSEDMPPVDWLKDVYKLFPELSFKLLYLENNMQLAGMAYSEDGSIEIEDVELRLVSFNGDTIIYDEVNEEFINSRTQELCHDDVCVTMHV